MIKYFMALSFFILFIIAVLFFIILIFSSKRFSPIPYFPTNKKDLTSIIKALNLKNNHAVFDLGAGVGTVIFAGAKTAKEKKLNTKFIAVEINPILILLLHLHRFVHSNKKNIKIIRGDMFKMSLRALAKQSHCYEIASSLTSFSPRNDKKTGASNITIYLYVSPWFLDKIAKKILQEIPKARIVSYMYPIKSLKKQESQIRGKNSIFIYK